MTTPYIGFSNDTLSQQPLVRGGDLIACPNCGGTHPLREARSDSGRMSLMFYDCKGTTYLGGINGRLMAGLKPDVSGEV